MRIFYPTKIKERLRECAFSAVIGLGVLALAGGAKEAKAQENLRYDIVRLKMPNVKDEGKSGRSYPYSINNHGEVIGMYCDETSIYYRGEFDHNFLYDNGDMIRMSSLLGECDSHCYGDTADNHMVINDLKDVLHSKRASHITYIYRIGEKWQFDVFAEDMSKAGAVGEKYHIYDGIHDITQRGEWPDVNSPYPVTKYEAHAINDKFQIVGSILLGEESSSYPYFITYEELAFLYGEFFWEPPYTRVILLERPYYIDPLDGKKYYYNCHASDINNNGKSVGWFGKETTPGVYSTHACIWDENGSITQLDTPFHDSRAYAINDNNEIVGYSYFGAVLGAVLYKDGRKINLNDFLPENSELEHLIVANGINNKSQIIGYGSLHGSTKLPYGFLAIPIPLKEDLTGDGIVNLYDLAEFASRWLMTEP